MGQNRKFNLFALLLAIVLAALTGWVEIFFGDINLALLAAMAFGLTVALIAPSRVWLWGVLIGLAPACAQLYMLIRGEPVERGEVQMSFAALLPAFVGAYGGYFMRRMVASVFDKGGNSEAAHVQEHTHKKSA